QTLDRWYGALRAVANVQTTPAKIPENLENALMDDLNTPLAISEIHELVSQLNCTTAAAEQAPIKSQLLAAGEVLGFLQKNPESWFKGQTADSSGPSDAEVENQIA